MILCQFLCNLAVDISIFHLTKHQDWGILTQILVHFRQLWKRSKRNGFSSESTLPGTHVLRLDSGRAEIVSTLLGCKYVRKPLCLLVEKLVLLLNRVRNLWLQTIVLVLKADLTGDQLPCDWLLPFMHFFILLFAHEPGLVIFCHIQRQLWLERRGDSFTRQLRLVWSS